MQHGADAGFSSRLDGWATPTRGDQALAPSVRLAIVSAVRLVRESLTLTLRDREGITIVDSLGLDAENIARIAEQAPDVVLIDLGHPDAAAAAQLIKFACADAKLVAFALAEVDEDVFACAAAGFSSYVPCESGADELYRALIDAARGRMHCAPHIAAAMFSRLSGLLQQAPSRLALPTLTVRENEILTLAEEGRSNKEIARRLQISSATVKNHIHNILQKLQVGRRGEAAARLRMARPD